MLEVGSKKRSWDRVGSVVRMWKSVVVLPDPGVYGIWDGMGDQWKGVFQVISGDFVLDFWGKEFLFERGARLVRKLSIIGLTARRAFRHVRSASPRRREWINRPGRG